MTSYCKFRLFSADGYLWHQTVSWTLRPESGDPELREEADVRTGVVHLRRQYVIGHQTQRTQTLIIIIILIISPSRHRGCVSHAPHIQLSFRGKYICRGTGSGVRSSVIITQVVCRLHLRSWDGVFPAAAGDAFIVNGHVALTAICSQIIWLYLAPGFIYNVLLFITFLYGALGSAAEARSKYKCVCVEAAALGLHHLLTSCSFAPLLPNYASQNISHTF